MQNSQSFLAASFRDPAGFLFWRDGVLYRQINHAGRVDYDRFIESGLYQSLISEGLLVAHQEVTVDSPVPALLYKIIQPDRVPFISYPYEWCFGQLQDAALTTLKLQKHALKFGMSLKDASAYNIQFVDGRAVLIDTLSFEVYKAGVPWGAYRQFCQHFLAPLALMAYSDVRLSSLLRVYIDGIPLDLASALLPFRTRLIFPLLVHLHIHARAQKRYADVADPTSEKPSRPAGQVSEISLMGMIDNLESIVRRLRWQKTKTAWADYYAATNYTSTAIEHKQHLVMTLLDRVQPRSVWDLGANTGFFSRIASAKDIPTVAFDVDPGAVAQNYAMCSLRGEKNLLPLVLDLTNPSPALGWQHEERSSFMERGPVDLIMALALIHHLAIGNNVPLARLAQFFSRLGRWLVVEFVPKSDSQVARLLATRRDIFPDYTPEGFEQAFAPFFRVVSVEKVAESERTIYLLENLDPTFSGKES